MIIHNFYLEKYDWKVLVIYVITDYDKDFILYEISKIKDDKDDLSGLIDMIDSDDLNHGYTFSNSLKRASILIIGPTSSADEFQDTFDHEKGHLAKHICLFENIDPYGEEAEYLAGDIGKKLFKTAKLLMCDNCRTRTINRIKGVN